MTGQRAPFITDMGKELIVRSPDAAFALERYAAWVFDPTRGKHQVMEVSNDLQALKEKYGISESGVVKMGPGKGEPAPPA